MADDPPQRWKIKMKAASDSWFWTRMRLPN